MYIYIRTYIDQCTSLKQGISYARVLVQVDLRNPLPHEIPIQLRTNKSYKQDVWYEWMPYYCALGHEVQRLVRVLYYTSVD